MMAECLKLAAKGAGYVSPNPMVGAVLVKNGRIVSRGYHKQYGANHAEVECLKNYRGALRGATLYVNLEPCCHFGKTPPCTDLLIKSGIRHVVVAMKDVNPVVAGKGIRKLRDAGIKVNVGIMEAEARRLNKAFITYVTRQRPFVHLKIAQTLDSKIAPLSKKTTIITSLKSRKLVHQWRGQHDAVLVGAGTITADDPLLDTRLCAGRNPAVIILDGELSISDKCRVIQSAQKRKVYLLTQRKKLQRKFKKAEHLEKKGVIILGFDSKSGYITPTVLLRALHKRAIASILVEGGSMVFSQFLHKNIVDKLSIFTAPWIMGSGLSAFQMSHNVIMKNVPRAKETVIQHIGPDYLIQAYF